MRLCLILIISSFIGFQNCSKVGFSNPSKSASSGSGQEESQGGSSSDPGSVPPDAFQDVQKGLLDGHFDLDTATRVYDFSSGTTNHHVHEYDDKFNTTYADFFNLADSSFDNIQEAVGADQRFVLIIANAELSRGGVVQINGVSESVVNYQKKVDAFIAGNTSALKVYTLSGLSDIKLSQLRIGFAPDALLKGGLVGTETSCVRRNDAGKLGEYRNGALVIQAIEVSQLKLVAATGVAAKDGGLLWEAALFWHWDQGCY